MKQMELLPVRHEVIDGIEMGVLNDGTPYLTARGLSRLCGQAPSGIIQLSSNWQVEKHKPRGRKISELLAAQDYFESELYIATNDPNGKPVHAHPDSVCMAVLEYYAFEADTQSKDIALRAFRLLARQSLRQFIYGRVGYDPANQIPRSWSHFHDRLVLNNFPRGYFSVFRETADIVISAIQQEGLQVDDHTVPDISIGKMWSKYWEKENLTAKYGDRIHHPHVYPDYFPQSQANSFIKPWVYPTEALHVFREWLNCEYLPKNFPAYIKYKVKKKALPPSRAELLIEALVPDR